MVNVVEPKHVKLGMLPVAFFCTDFISLMNNIKLNFTLASFDISISYKGLITLATGDYELWSWELIGLYTP